MEKQKIFTHKDLIVWQKSMDLVTLIYHLTSQFPRQELYGLSNQMRSAAVSIPSNIAEGRRHGTKKEYLKFLRIAYGSATELETQLEIVQRLSMANNSDCKVAEALLIEVQKMLNAMIKNLNPKSST